MAEITQTISTVTSLPTPPNPNNPATFDALAYPYTVAQNAFGVDVNDMAAELNTFATQANAVKDEVNTAKSDAINAKEIAETARDEAVGAVSTLPDGIINDGTVSATDTWSSQKIDTDKQDTLVSGTNIKTIGGASILGSGDIVIGATDYQEFTTSGTWTKPAGCNFVYVELLGGGGSGGKGTGTTAGVTRQGGGGGEFVSKLLLASELSLTVSAIVGAGGVGKSVDGHGYDGGITSFSTISAFGGKGGGGTNNNYRGFPRDPKTSYTASTGESLATQYTHSGVGSILLTLQYGYSLYGGGGGASAYNTYTSIEGGVSEFAGNGGASVTTEGALVDGQYPAGGGGASNGSFTSGSGAAGRVRVWAW